LIFHRASTLPLVSTPTLAKQLYDWAHDLLSTSTKRRFAASSGIHVGEPFEAGKALAHA
jgi:hypothetical protein